MSSLQATAKRIGETEASVSENSKVDRYIKFVYDKIKFGKSNRLQFEVFKNAYFGYLNLREAGKINEGSLLTVCDFTLSSNVKRMWVIDLSKKKVLFNTLVAHGMGTGEEFAENFSNTEDSHQSSLGFYVTGETYTGNNGYSLKLNGVDGSFNSKAYDRAIVVHGAEYVSEEFAAANKRIGRSHGCPALPMDIAPKVIDKIQNGQCLFIYHNSRNYLRSSFWLNNRIAHLPEEAELIDLNLASSKTSERELDECVVSSNSKDKAKTEVKSLHQIKRETKPQEKKYTMIINIHEGPNGSVSDTLIIK